MTREDVLKLFPEATDDQITKLLNQNNSEVSKGKEKLKEKEAEIDRLKEENGKLGELQAQIEEAENSKLTEVEKLKKDLDSANSEIAEMKKRDIIRNLRDEAMANYKITSEQARQVVKDDGTYDSKLLGQIISDKESAAALAKEQEIAKASTNPGGQSGGSSNSGDIAKEMAVASAKRAGTANNSILDYYRRH